MVNKTQFADRLKNLRKRKEISQGDFERGETNSNAKAMTRLAKALDTTVVF